MRWVLAIALVGCGRIGFDAASPPPDDGGVTAEAIGEIDPAFGGDGQTVTSDATFGVSPFGVVPRGTGYMSVGVYGNTSGFSRFALIGITASGDHDTSFDGDGLRDVGATTNDFGYGALRIDDARILVNGDGGSPGTDDDFTLGVVADNGAPDPSFGTGGFVRLDFLGAQREDTANRAALVGGTIVACGVSGYDLPDASYALARFDLAGNLVTSWGTNGQVSDDFVPNAQDICTDVIGLGRNIVTVGHSAEEQFVVAAYDDVTGARAAGFATGGVFMLGSANARARGVAIADGDIIAVGSRGTTALVLRLAADGTRRGSFGADGEVELAGIDTLADVVVQTNGKLVVAGDGAGIGVIARLLPDGSPDEAFGIGGRVELPRIGGESLEVQSAMIDGEGRIVVVGIRGSDPLSAVTARIR